MTAAPMQGAGMERVMVLSRRLRRAFLVAVATFLLIFVASALQPGTEGLGGEGRAGSDPSAGSGFTLRPPDVRWDGRSGGEVPWREKVLLVGLASPFVVVWVAIFYQFERLLALYQRGRVFDRVSAARIRKAGSLLVLTEVIGIGIDLLEGPLRYAAGLTEDLVMELTLSFEPGVMLFVFLGLALAIVGRVMEEAAALSEDAALTV